jgi:murein DD-endopeptidase MepM/ murein hydrolase activator NlpD
MKKVAVVVGCMVVVVAGVIGMWPVAEKVYKVYQLVHETPAQHLPVPVQGVNTAKFINSWGYPRSGGRHHQGIDIFAPRDRPVLSTTHGLVTKVGIDGLGGQVVMVMGPGREMHYYAHLDKYGTFKTGDLVNSGDVLGYVGDTGNAKGTPYHLHYGIYRQGIAINPYMRFAVPSLAQQKTVRKKLTMAMAGQTKAQLQ